METPKNESGQLTEMIMFQALENCDQRHELRPTTGQYNAFYEAVYDVIEKTLQRFNGGGGM